MNWKFPVFWGVVGIFLLPFFGFAQNEPPPNSTSDEDDTNAPAMADLMETNNVVTNTVGIVLVKISPQLWAGKYEVTQDSYEKVTGENPSAFKGGQNPVDSVSWNNATAFCTKLTEQEKGADQLPDGYAYSLPTEVQWEKLVDNASLDDAIMSLNGSRRTSTAPVGTLKPNSLGLCDTRGNVMEWCLDSHDPAYYVLRGGSWNTWLEPNSRIAFRWYAKPDEKMNTFGFRVVLEPKQ